MHRLELTIQKCDGEVCSQPLRVVSFGGLGGSPFSCDVADGHALVGFAGGLGGHLHSIAVYTGREVREVRAWRWPRRLPCCGFQGAPTCNI